MLPGKTEKGEKERVKPVEETRMAQAQELEAWHGVWALPLAV